MPSTEEIPKIQLYYHPNCKASNKLLNNINKECSGLFNFIDISKMTMPPSGLSRVPAIQMDGNFIYGKECFDTVGRSIMGPSSCDVFKSGSKIDSFNSSGSEIQMNPQFSGLGRGMDGFKGIPNDDETQSTPSRAPVYKPM